MLRDLMQSEFFLNLRKAYLKKKKLISTWDLMIQIDNLPKLCTFKIWSQKESKHFTNIFLIVEFYILLDMSPGILE